jgi:alkanesulfonate monooxygenase SsuD/methylene tetrahydromethanopterin reductase-like flavin-dependent oxidoreductase (luciferase family)
VNLSGISIGLAAAIDDSVIRAIAPRIEAAGFRGLWLNDTPDGDSLAGLRSAAEVTTHLRLATGVIPLDRRPASAVVRAMAGLPTDRLVLGISAGAGKGTLDQLADGIDTIRASSDVPILVGALGPRLRHLAATRADGVLFNWLTPQAARTAMSDLRRDSASAGRDAIGALYVRATIDSAALPALAAEAARYQAIPSYAANFDRIGARAIDTTIDGTDPEAFAERIGELSAIVDELILRIVAPDTSIESHVRFLDTVSSVAARIRQTP